MFEIKSLPKQDEIWIKATDVVVAHSHPFYDRLKKLLNDNKFGDQVRELCSEHYRLKGPGQPGVDPEVYCKMLLIGFYKNISSEREIAEVCHDSIAIRGFLGYNLTENTPDHSTLSVIRKRLSSETFDNIFKIMLPVLEKEGLINGKDIGMDTSVMEANASLLKLQNRLTGEQYRKYVEKLAKEDGVDTSDPAAVSKYDRKRKKKVSNEEWVNPHDPDAKIGPTKRGNKRMIYKPEHTVDMETGAILDARVQPGDMADSTNLTDRVMQAEMFAAEGLDNGEMDLPLESVTADKGYYSDNEIADLSEYDIHVNIPDRLAVRKLEKLAEDKRKAVEESKRFVSSGEGKALLRKRGMHIERSFAHVLDSGGMRRTTLRGQENIQKRYIISALAYNISLVMYKIFGYGTPRQYAAGNESALFFGFLRYEKAYICFFLLQVVDSAIFQIIYAHVNVSGKESC